MNVIYVLLSFQKKRSNHKKHNLKDKRIEQLNAELQTFKSFIREELYALKKWLKIYKDKKQNQITQ